MASIRFSKIGSVIRLPDGTYSVGPIPEIGGPFSTAADFFRAWAKRVKFPLQEEVIREFTPVDMVDEILSSIRVFPSQIKKLANTYCFQEGPFPLFHGDLFKSNIIIDSDYNILSVIDWEDAIVVPWEMVEFIKDLCFVPLAMAGPQYCEGVTEQQILAERDSYNQLIRETEIGQKQDNRLSETLNDCVGQSLATAMWLYKGGRIGIYTNLI
jgi:hypothetical protein